MRALLHEGERMGVEMPQIEELRGRIRRREWEDSARRAMGVKATLSRWVHLVYNNLVHLVFSTNATELMSNFKVPGRHHSISLYLDPHAGRCKGCVPSLPLPAMSWCPMFATYDAYCQSAQTGMHA